MVIYIAIRFVPNKITHWAVSVNDNTVQMTSTALTVETDRRLDCIIKQTSQISWAIWHRIMNTDRTSSRRCTAILKTVICGELSVALPNLLE